MMDRPSDSDLDRAAALATELRHFSGKLKRQLRDRSDLGDLSWSQISVLSRIERDGPATVTALARAEGMRPQSMGAIVSVLEIAGHLAGRPHPSDGRQTIWSLTQACRDWVEAGRAARQDWLFRAILSRLTPDEQATLAQAIPLLNRLVEPD